MASNMQSFPRILKMLRENSNIKDKREALTYIRSNSKKLESTKAIKEEQYKEICKLVIDAFANGNIDIQNEAFETLNIIIRDFKYHPLCLFESVVQMDHKNKLKIFKLLNVIQDNTMLTVAYDAHTVNFFNNCMCTVQMNKMPWMAPTACVDNLQALIEAESRPLSDDQRLEEEIINNCMSLLTRLYKVAAMTSDIKVQRFNALLLDKVMMLAYMGYKRQRVPALQVLEQALATDILSHIRTKLPIAWTQYKAALQSMYCKRMLLLVSMCEVDWALQWNVTIQFLGMDLHRGAGLINNLLSVEEKAFKSTDTIIRRQAFLSWKLLVDNFALDPQELATARRIKLLCIPLNAKNCKNELIALTKLEVWWHVIIKLYKDINKFVNPVITQFLNFCFGPLGDTPLLSSKFDIVASPGKRFFKTKVVAVDALCQLLVTKQENTVLFPVLEERLPHSISDAVFQECYKAVIHSVGEALLVLSQLTDAEMKNRYQLGKMLWTSLVNYVQETKMEKKELTYKSMIQVITELSNYAMDKPMIRNLFLNIILFEVADFSKNFSFQDDMLSRLVLKFLQIPLLIDFKKNHYSALKSLFSQCIKSPKKNEYYTHSFQCLKEIYEILYALSETEHTNQIVIFELWRILAEVLIQYMDDLQEINEGSATEHNLKTINSVVIHPFMYIEFEDQKQVQELVNVWKRLYKQFEMRTDLMETVKINEIILNIAGDMLCCLVKNEKCFHLLINCLDTLLSIVNYKFLLGNAEVPSIIHLIMKLIPYALSSKNVTECELVLKSFSAVLSTIYGQSPHKVISYLHVWKPVIELILSSELETLFKEIETTWEVIISIFKGLNKLVDYDLISSYKKVMIQALNHSNVGIQTQTLSLFEIEDELSSNAKSVLEEIKKNTSKGKIPTKPNISKKKEPARNLPNQVKIVGSFLTRDSSNPKFIFKESDKILPEPDSEDYVLIKTDVTFDVSRLTEHQKESLKRKREDIPALYNDLSQSCSQDTQNLQEWFDKKNQTFEVTDKTIVKDSVSIKDYPNDDANKENTIDIKTEIIENDPKLTESSGQTVSLEAVQNSKSDIENNENLLAESMIKVEKSCTDVEVDPLSDTAINDLTLDSQEQFPANVSNDERLSPSVLDNGKRRNRNCIVIRPVILTNSEEIVSSVPGQSNSSSGLQRTLRTKIPQSKPNMINEQKTSDNTESKLVEAGKKGVKRKSQSDSENEGTSQRQRRKTSSLETASDSDSSKSTESDNTMAPHLEGIIGGENLPKRTKNEISRLRINMIFDSPLPNSRRSKGGYDDHRDYTFKRHSPDYRATKSRCTQRTNDKELNAMSKRGKTSKVKIKTDKSNEPIKTKDTKELEEETKQEENVQTAVGSKSTPDAKCDTRYAKKYGKSGKAVSCNDVQNKDSGSSESISKSQDEERPETQDDTQNIIVSSQEISKLEKKCTEKQCFIKINKIGDIRQTTKSQEIAVEPEGTNEIALNNCDNDNNEVFKDNIEEFDETNETNTNKPKILISESSLCDNDTGEAVFEVQKGNEGSSGKSVLGFMSPKSSMKPNLKLKTYSTQCRAAHMLGLVIKQAKMETECHTAGTEDESAVKKAKLKDTDSGEATVIGKKERAPIFKEADKVTASCSSRQEKIFSNMRSSEYCLSPPIKLFSNLKNDGEKIFTKTDKSMNCVFVQTDEQVESPNEESMMDELPMLELSGVNPHSLTTSPSVSILKRQRQSGPELEAEAKTPKRKRVSFADPPVSKEMGYNTTTSESPHKNKFVPRLLGRRDSPLRLRQIRQKLIRFDAEKMDKEDEADINSSEIDLQCERENELLTKLAEELEYSENIPIDTDIQGSCTSVETTNIGFTDASECNKIEIENFGVEYEVTQDTTFSKRTDISFTDKVDHGKKDEALKNANSSIADRETTEFDESQTQDIFNAKDSTNHIDNIEFTETSTNSNVNGVENTSIQINSMDTVKLNITNDSIINNSSNKHTNSEILEDTVEVDNVNSLNSSDEIFCGKLIRTSTQAVESSEEQDTISVTDSVFGSLPLSQDSQNTNESDVEIPHPESLDFSQPIYPKLTSCTEPLSSIIEQLTNPLWVRNLSTYFESRKLQTIGDLAQLSEREVNRIPVKSQSKSEFVKSVLKRFEKTYFVKDASSVTLCLNDALNNKAFSVVNTNVPAQTESVTTQTELTNIATNNDASKTSKIVPESTTGDSTKAAVLLCATTSEPLLETKSNGQSPQISNASLSFMVIPIAPEDGSFNSNMNAKSMHSLKSVGTCTSTDTVYHPEDMPPRAKPTKSVASQMALEDLLDEIDVNLVLESAVRRSSPEKILSQYKNKLMMVPQVDLERETMRMLGAESTKNYNEVTLKASCRACGVNKVLLRLPDIFSSDKQFFVKVLNAYRKKIQTSDCLNILEFAEIKDAVCQKCTSSELAEMLSTKLKEEEQEGIRKPMTELSSLDAMLKRMPMDVIISHTVANDELIPSRVVLEIALQNNSPSDIVQALESQSPVVTKNVFDKLWSSQFAVKHIEESNKSNEELLKIFKAVSSRLSQQELLKAFSESMNEKIMVKEEND
ncbi:telomere-associated protein RIF1-like isoform X1 [Colletes gigas]|uniref:telomere-associated protein RIF1-like isoform X1 n=1 Tax=Colletes gigas TaxID=935657 RepID=UPI001C9B82EE|nr:telomere-associated protein RIF1-like isoform X1 [Colletes gigas]